MLPNYGWSAAGRAIVLLSLLSCALTVGCRDAREPLAPATPMPAPTSMQTIAVPFCTARAPIWVAFRDGDSVWTRAIPEASGNTTTFRHQFSGTHGAIATVTPTIDSLFTIVSVLYGAPDELAAEGDTSRVDCAGTGTKTLLGSVVGLDEGLVAHISLGLSSDAAAVTSGDFALEQVAAGPQDLLASFSGLLAVPAANARRLIVRRNFDLSDSATIAPLDFHSAEVFDVATANVTVTDAVLTVISQNTLYTANGQFMLPFAADQSTATTGTRPYHAIPESKLAPGEVQALRLLTVGAENENRAVDTYFRAPVDRTLQLGTRLVAPTITSIGAAGAASLRLRAHFVAQPEYDKVASIVYTQAPASNVINVSMTPRYASIAGGYDLDVPDLQSVPGYDPSWGLRAGETITWQAFRVGGSLPYGPNTIPFDGAVRIISQRSDTVTVR